jgi:hypothetical protein
MKKKIVIISIFLFIILLFSFQRVRIDVPDTEVTIYKNYALGERALYFEEYLPITLSNEEDIDELFSHINSLRYRKRLFPAYMDIIGYTYMIEWEENTIYIIGYKYFIYRSIKGDLTFGSFKFLDDYDWIKVLDS